MWSILRQFNGRGECNSMPIASAVRTRDVLRITDGRRRGAFSNRVSWRWEGRRAEKRVVSRRPQPAQSNVFTDPPIVNWTAMRTRFHLQPVDLPTSFIHRTPLTNGQRTPPSPWGFPSPHTSPSNSSTRAKVDARFCLKQICMRQSRPLFSTWIEQRANKLPRTRIFTAISFTVAGRSTSLVDGYRRTEFDATLSVGPIGESFARNSSNRFCYN